jgi:hypothetical protein
MEKWIAWFQAAPFMQRWIDWLEATPLADFVFTYTWAWPVCEALHFMALVLLVGSVGLFDLRVLGLGKGIPPAAIHRLVPFGLLGFVVSVLTGAVFISGTPDQYFFNAAFHFKVVFLALMGLNVGFFYVGPHRVVSALGPHDDAPRTAKVSATLSLVFLIAVMCCGRMLTFYRPM